jgi:DNA-directed RNA polymerase specialized sigma subunit
MSTLSDYALLPEEDLAPTYSRPGVLVEEQEVQLQRLRQLQNAIPAAQRERDQLIVRLAREGVLSRRDMARACGLCKSRVDQILSSPASRLSA